MVPNISEKFLAIGSCFGTVQSNVSCTIVISFPIDNKKYSKFEFVCTLLHPFIPFPLSLSRPPSLHTYFLSVTLLQFWVVDITGLSQLHKAHNQMNCQTNHNEYIQ